MTKGVPLIPQDWVPLFREFIKFIRINSKEVPAIDKLGAPLNLWPSQEIALETVVHGLERGAHMFMFGKARQLGMSTFFETLDIFWLATHPGMMGAYVIDKDKNLPAIRDKIKRYFSSFPPGFFGKSFKIENDNKEFMLFSNGSRLDFLTAGVGKKETHWGEGKGYAFVHLCMARGTPVILEHGITKPVEEVRIGDKLLTHTGKAATVIDVFGQSGKDKPIVKISPWLGESIKYTTWHKIPTQRGLIEAGKITKNDLLVMPIRRISNEKRFDILPSSGFRHGKYSIDKSTGRFVRSGTTGSVAREQNPWLLINTKGCNEKIVFNEDLGFAVGYYLAEGHLRKNSLGVPCGIVFTRHRNEKKYSDRALDALKKYTTGHTKIVDRKNCLTTAVSIYGTSFAKWLGNNFGCLDDKRIPDEIFTWGKEFCKGLLCGLLSGDGSKTVRKNSEGYISNIVVLPTTRSSIAMQARDIAASLGYGWASIKFKPAGTHYGRNCKACWRVTWSGGAAAKLRELMGLVAYKRHGNDFINKYIIEKNRVLIKIKSIELCPDEKEVWDISVNHSDHTFRTPYMSTSNTEVAKYGNEAGLESFRATLSESNPDRLFIYESTSKGFNHWRSMWQEFGEDEFRKRRMFIGWWGNPFNVVRKNAPAYKVYGLADPDPKEQELIDKVKEDYGVSVTQEQLAWYRQEHRSSQSLESLHQNYPWTIEESFVATGHSFFQMYTLQKEVERVKVIPYHGYKYVMGNDFWSVVLERIVDKNRIDEVVLRVWEEPDENGTYVITCDPAWGRGEDKDKHAIEVYRCFGDKILQVAEYADNAIDTRQAAWVLCHLAGAYKNCVINVEINGPGGVIITELENLRERMRIDPKFEMETGKNEAWDNFLDNARWYLYKKPDHWGPGFVKCWETTAKTKAQIMHGMRDKYVTEVVIIQSRLLAEEMMDVIQNGDSIEAPPPAHDDRVFATALAIRTWVDSFQMSLLANGETYERYLTGTGGETMDKSTKFVNNIVQNFFLAAEAQAELPQIPAGKQWLWDKGFI